jgi:hypothetical protein
MTALNPIVAPTSLTAMPLSDDEAPILNERSEDEAKGGTAFRSEAMARILLAHQLPSRNKFR